MFRISASLFIVLFAYGLSNAQVKNSQLGSTDLTGRGSQNAFFDYSDPEAVNIKISVWGSVKYPGKYLVPSYTSVLDLISYAGGPAGDADMSDLKLYRVNENGKEKLIDFSYNDIVNEDKLQEKNRIVPKLEPGDFLIVPAQNATSFRDILNLSLQIVSVVVSVISIVLWSRR